MCCWEELIESRGSGELSMECNVGFELLNQNKKVCFSKIRMACDGSDMCLRAGVRACACAYVFVY